MAWNLLSLGTGDRKSPILLVSHTGWGVIHTSRGKPPGELGFHLQKDGESEYNFKGLFGAFVVRTEILAV